MAEVKYDFAPPPPWPDSSPELGQAHTQILISAAVQRVCDHCAQSTVTFLKNIKKYTKVAKGPSYLGVFFFIF